MTRRQDVLPNSDFLVHFYLVMHLGLTSEDQVFCDSPITVAHKVESAYDFLQVRLGFMKIHQTQKFSVVSAYLYTATTLIFQNCKSAFITSRCFCPLTLRCANRIWTYSVPFIVLDELASAYVVKSKKWCGGSAIDIVPRKLFWSLKTVWKVLFL